MYKKTKITFENNILLDEVEKILNQNDILTFNLDSDSNSLVIGLKEHQVFSDALNILEKNNFQIKSIASLSINIDAIKKALEDKITKHQPKYQPKYQPDINLNSNFNQSISFDKTLNNSNVTNQRDSASEQLEVEILDNNNNNNNNNIQSVNLINNLLQKTFLNMFNEINNLKQQVNQSNLENIYGKNKVFYTDVTFHSIFGIKFYQSTILEATTRRIIDVKFSFKNDTELIMRNMKGFKRQLIKDNLWKDNLIMHSDHGSVYFSKKYQKWAYKNKITISMGRTYSCSDNVIIEIFHSLIKKWKYKLRKKFTSFKNYLQKLIYWCSEYNYLKTQTKSNFYYQPLIKIFKFFTNFSKKV
ncbi:integrase core domain protein [Mycoplasma leachii PG50]|uniref:Integrase core domain protein n=1 Tax=Mycoplasma leachii (strain DSM 21131 / NCTC 10133 / N29 / PG50) TaxID=880447 RepID=E4PUJ8_MYCLG|nr:DDE-type integrase/transposase/recombinase [Mycoplasma leachii]ADR23968.1 integrase core domain protein [Mycoplasma leachii PG50]